MKPVSIKSGDQCLTFDKQKKHASIKLTQDCNIKIQIFEYFLDLIPNIASLDIQISESQIKDKEQYNTFLKLRSLLLTKIITEVKNLNNFNIEYSSTNIGSVGIKNIAQFISSIINKSKSTNDCKISINYTSSLMNYDDIFANITQEYNNISGYITHFHIKFLNDLARENLLTLSRLFNNMKNVKEFIFQSSTSLNLKTDDNLSSFIQSMKNIISSAVHFEFDISEASNQSGVISSLPECLSLLISHGSEELKSVVINFEKVGWTFDRKKLIKNNFINGIATYMHKWPLSIENLKMNYDRALSYNQNVNCHDIKILLDSLKKIIKQLKTFSLNLNGIGYQMNDSTQVIPNNDDEDNSGNIYIAPFGDNLVNLFENGQNLNEIELKISGHLHLSYKQWEQLMKNITNINNLQSIILDIERWKDFGKSFSHQEQYKIIHEQLLMNLYKNNNKNLRTLKLNIDDWEYLRVYKKEYAEMLLQFDYLQEIQVLFYKSESQRIFKNLELIQDMIKEQKQMVIRLPVLKKLGIDSDTINNEYEILQNEKLLSHMKYYFLINRNNNSNLPILSSIINKNKL